VSIVFLVQLTCLPVGELARQISRSTARVLSDRHYAAPALFGVPDNPCSVFESTHFSIAGHKDLDTFTLTSSTSRRSLKYSLQASEQLKQNKTPATTILHKPPWIPSPARVVRPIDPAQIAVQLISCRAPQHNDSILHPCLSNSLRLRHLIPVEQQQAPRTDTKVPSPDSPRPNKRSHNCLVQEQRSSKPVHSSVGKERPLHRNRSSR